MTLAATTNDLALESHGWAERSTDLAEWALDRVVNRTDAWGQYLPPARRSTRTRADGSTAVDTAITAKGELTLAELTAHFRGADLGHLIGLHSTSHAQTCRWGAVDVDQHDERDEPQAAANFRYATHLLGKLEAAGITALLLDSNGRGGFHLIVLFDEPVPAARVHAWLRSLVADASGFGVGDVEVFPKQTRIAAYGNWLRLPGRHHTHEHWTRVWAEGTWFAGEEAVELILSHPPTPASRIPATNEVQVSVAPPGTDAPDDSDERLVASVGDRATALAALRHIPNDDLPYDDWLRVGAALHHVGDDLLSAWRGWSALSVKHAPGECERSWRHFRRDRGDDAPTATLHTLLGLARVNGYEPDAAATGGDVRPRFKSVGELCRDHPDLRPPVIHGILREGESGNLVAGPKSNKSWLVLQLSMSIATGRMWLGHFPVEQGAVLIVDNELHEETIASRIPKVASAMGIGLSELRDRLCVESLRGRLKDIHGLAGYFAGIEPGRFKLIVLDALYRLLPSGIDENSNADMAAVYNAIDQYAARLGCAFILVHHVSKGIQANKSVTDVGAGAGAQSRATDAHVVLRPHEEEGCVVLDAVVRSWAPVNPFVIRWDFPVWKPAPELDPAQLRQESRRKARKELVESTAKVVEPWTTARFVREFLGDRVVDVEVLLARAGTAGGLSGRASKQFVKLAVADGLAFEWSHPTDKRKKRLATRPQTVLESGAT